MTITRISASGVRASFHQISLQRTEFLSNLIKQLLCHISQGLMGEFAVVTLIAFGSSVKELAWVLMCDGRLRNRNN